MEEHVKKVEGVTLTDDLRESYNEVISKYTDFLKKN